MNNTIPKAITDGMEAELAKLRKRLLDRDALIQTAYLAGVGAGMAYAQNIYKEIKL